MSRTSLCYVVTIGIILGGGISFVAASVRPDIWPIGVLVFLVSVAVGLRKPLRRTRAVKRSLSEESHRWIEEEFPWLDRLDGERFYRDVKIVLGEWIFEGVDGVDVTDSMKAGIAAGAALLLHGRPKWEFPSRQTVLFYPDRFDVDYLSDESSAFDGMAHRHGPVILSARAIDESWADPTDGSNVVLHELAHLLDFDNEFADGVPSLVDPGSTVAWRELVRKETRRVRLGRSILRRYAATNHAEFFAVAVENFFERPDLLKSRHGALYDALAALFNLDIEKMAEAAR